MLMMMITLLSLYTGAIDELEHVRRLYLEAALGKQEVMLLEKYCDAHQFSEPTLAGYCSMTYFLDAKNAFNPYRKLKSFGIGRKKLDSLITKYPDNTELRYLRHSIQDRVPGFLGYDEEKEPDQEMMKSNLSSISDSSTYDIIYQYLNNVNQ